MRIDKVMEKLSNPVFHARWLNTLSYLENCGARLIARSEHPTMVRREVLKHAAEEFRHAYYLKSLIGHIHPPGLSDYSVPTLVGGMAAYQFMNRLNLTISRWLLSGVVSDRQTLKEYAYLLVTYVIEKRALEIYPAYESFLRGSDSPISIRGIIREEKHHLQEIEEELDQLEGHDDLQRKAIELEQPLFAGWLTSI